MSRSKEVDLAINQLKEDVNIIIYGNQMFEDRTTCKKDDLKTVLAYIEELEENEKVLSAKLVKRERQIEELQNKIRDKIKELDETKQYWTEEVIDILKSIIGE